MDVNNTTFSTSKDNMNNWTERELNCANSELNSFSCHRPPSSPVDDDIIGILIIVFYVVLGSSISILGIITNIVNILVFLRQGFTESINFSFFGMAISDLLVGILNLVMCLANNPWLSKYDHCSIILAHRVAFIAMYAQTVFFRVTGWLTAFITLERCLCVAIPLKVKDIITPTRTKVAIVVIFTLSAACVMPFYYTFSLVKGLDATRNRTVTVIHFHKNKQGLVECLVFMNYIFSPLATFFVVVGCSIFLCIRMRQSAKRRENVLNSQHERTKRKEKKMIKVVVSIALVYIICYTPELVVTCIDIQLHRTKMYREMVVVLNAVVSFFIGFNSSWNISIYYVMSTKYRQTFRLMFCKKKA